MAEAIARHGIAVSIDDVEGVTPAYFSDAMLFLSTDDPLTRSGQFALVLDWCKKVIDTANSNDGDGVSRIYVQDAVVYDEDMVDAGYPSFFEDLPQYLDVTKPD